MVEEAPADLFRDDKNTTKSALLPQRHPNHDLFICDVLDAIPKDDMASMEHPIFSLATKASVDTSNPAIDDHFKTGHMSRAQDLNLF